MPKSTAAEIVASQASSLDSVRTMNLTIVPNLTEPIAVNYDLVQQLATQHGVSSHLASLAVHLVNSHLRRCFIQQSVAEQDRLVTESLYLRDLGIKLSGDTLCGWWNVLRQKLEPLSAFVAAIRTAHSLDSSVGWLEREWEADITWYQKLCDAEIAQYIGLNPDSGTAKKSKLAQQYCVKADMQTELCAVINRSLRHMYLQHQLKVEKCERPATTMYDVILAYWTKMATLRDRYFDYTTELIKIYKIDIAGDWWEAEKQVDLEWAQTASS